ncbi:hypothetical protein ACH5AL_12625 [Actinacidiphila glaucinigra]|uniref:hypothetical protein n=1 Tax=Actinacidiphila glaucinigra TaxID=235986 RepID=UPI0037872852
MGSVKPEKSPAGAWLLIAVVALAVGVAMVLQTRGALAREPEFRAAPPCVAVPVKASAPATERCRPPRHEGAGTVARARQPMVTRVPAALGYPM